MPGKGAHHAKATKKDRLCEAIDSSQQETWFKGLLKVLFCYIFLGTIGVL